MVLVSGGVWKGQGKTVVMLGDDFTSISSSTHHQDQSQLLLERLETWLTQNLKVAFVSIVYLSQTPTVIINITFVALPRTHPPYLCIVYICIYSYLMTLGEASKRRKLNKFLLKSLNGYKRVNCLGSVLNA